jgi:Flp pilus assembly protein TadG
MRGVGQASRPVFFKQRRSGQATIEFALLYTAAILPLTFMAIFVSEMLWVWHSVVDFTRVGANYAATHCWMGDGSNVTTYMTTHVPRMIDMDKFQTGQAGLQVSYFALDPATGQLSPFACPSGADCSASCIPDAVTVSVTSYQFTKGLSTFFKLPPVTIPPFATSMPMQSAGCDESGNCLP